MRKKDKKQIDKKGKKKVVNLYISDIQAPFHHEDTIEFLRAVKKKYKPTHVYCVGDEADFHNLGNWAKDPDGFGANEEYNAMIKLMKKLYKLFPICKVAISNHTSRPFRKAFDCGIPKVFLKSYRDFMEAPIGWTWHQEILTTDGILIVHGDGLAGGATKRKGAIKNNMKSIVFGHFHTESGIDYIANKTGLFWGMVVGSLIDQTKYAFAYQKKSPIKPILSVGLSINGIPQIIPMVLNKKGRWIGKL